MICGGVSNGKIMAFNPKLLSIFLLIRNFHLFFRRHIIRSSSEESLGSVRSYVSIGRSKPRYSGMPSKRDIDIILGKRSESYPSCPPPLPPYPKHRLSIASTAEIGKLSSRETISAFEKHTCPIHKINDDTSVETENHYNLII